ncbi:hypothetical protein LguiA_013001 [Lonicera macranthoides]
MGGMDLLVTSWYNGVQSLPENYIMPPERRPNNFSICTNIPVVDLAQELNHGRTDLLEQIMKASQEYGVFQVINHGISEEMMSEAISLNKEFFVMPAEEKAGFYCEDFYHNIRLYTSGYNYYAEDVHYWKDTLKLPCNLLESHLHSWPHRPHRYREVVGPYTVEVRMLTMRILELIGKGLGLEAGYFKEERSSGHGLVINYYPPCPEPSLALGIRAHCDAYLITLIQQNNYGLQITKKDGEWVGVDPLPNAFVVMIANQLQVISNGKLRSAEHRGVTNLDSDRISIVNFFGPSKKCLIEPAKALVSTNNPSRFRSFKYIEFLEHYMACLANKDLRLETTLRPYELQS